MHMKNTEEFVLDRNDVANFISTFETIFESPDFIEIYGDDAAISIANLVGHMKDSELAKENSDLLEATPRRAVLSALDEKADAWHDSYVSVGVKTISLRCCRYYPRYVRHIT